MSSELYQSGEYAQKNPDYHVEDSAWKARQILDMLARHQLDPRTVCDIGCGAGQVLVELQKRLDDGVRFAGYEVSPQAFELCSGRENERLRFFREETPAVSYDLLVCMDVVEHVEDCFGFTRKLKPVARHKIFHFPLDLSVQTVLRAKPLLFVRQAVGHIHYFSRETALALLEDCGLEVVDWVYTKARIDRANTASARLMALPRRLAAAVSPDLAARLLGGFSLLVLAR